MRNPELSGALIADGLARHMGTVIAVRDIEGQEKQSFSAEPSPQFGAFVPGDGSAMADEPSLLDAEPRVNRPLCQRNMKCFVECEVCRVKFEVKVSAARTDQKSRGPEGFRLEQFR